jgi:FimV-like protein
MHIGDACLGLKSHESGTFGAIMLRLMRLTLITLALAIPAGSYALGLGDIHVESALHQPLVAQIELVGVVNDELGRVSASLASDELFQKYNLERAPFIYGTKLTVGRDAQGRPVLNMRSTEKFTEPVVTLLVDMHTPNGELVREYTLFLDPAGLVTNAGSGSSTSSVESTAGVGLSAATAPNAARASDAALKSDSGSAASSPSKAERAGRAASTSPGTVDVADHETPTSAPASTGASYELLGTKYTIARRDTLARIVAATGARSRTDRHRMMIAIYRANPAAFQNNFNRMHTGVMLTFPTAEQLAAISVDETNREYDTQMAEWRASLHHGASATNRASAGAGDAFVSHDAPGSAAANAAAAVVAANNAREANGGSHGDGALPTDHAALTQRIASLEQSLAQIQQQLKRPALDQTSGAATASAMAGSLGTAPDQTKARASAPHDTAPAPTSASQTSAASIAAGHATPASAENYQGSLAHVTDSASQTSAASIAAGRATPAPAAASHAAAASMSEPVASNDATSEDDEDDSPPAKHRGYQLIAIGVGAGLLFFAGAWFYLRRRNSYAYHMTPRYPLPVAAATAASEPEATEHESSHQVEFSTPPPPLPHSAARAAEPVEAQQPAAPKDAKSASSWFEDSFSTPIADLLNDPTVSLGVDDTPQIAFETAEPAVKLPRHTPESTVDTEVLVAPELEFAGDTVEQKFSFFNPEATTNTEHVVMDSASPETKPFVERRKNPADVLRQAIEREPERSDLRLKLLELYYTAAAENRRAFLDATRQLAKNEKLASPEDWSRIADMGRNIAPDDKLFCSEVDDKRVA